ncbi:hypothetical protein [Cryobacterium sp. Y50]|nr:hypothetical protein [Cryobacterium sp. Y50]
MLGRPDDECQPADAFECDRTEQIDVTDDAEGDFDADQEQA